MQAESTVVDGRCDFFEPFGQTHSWRVLDADNNVIPVQGETYYVAVFLQDHVSAKFGVALGTWVEDFRTQYTIDTPSCERDMSDFSEKEGTQAECFPVVSCPATGPVGCINTSPQEQVCEKGEVCEDPSGCVIAGVSYTPPTMGACGGERCPAAVQTWETVNMEMHMGMNFEYTGNANIDFARGMIPHHLGAVDMCRALIEDLTCTDVSDIDNLEGLVHFCSHVQYEQEIEVGGLRGWLAMNGLEENAPCPTAQVRSSHKGMTMDTGHMSAMPESCGFVSTPSASAFIDLNHKMHALMAIEYSCDHSVDFVRMMVPHHAGAIEMCDILLETTKDDYLIELCGNITLTQRAEIAWMHDWLISRELATSAPCGDCEEADFIAPPCEDILSTSSFCHGLGFGQDGYCRCEDTLEAGFSCEEDEYVDGVGVFVPIDLCKRTCGLCPEDMRPIWPGGCYEPIHDMPGTESESMPEDGALRIGVASSFVIVVFTLILL